LEIRVATIAEMTTDELKAFIEGVVDAKLSELLAQAKMSEPPNEWLPEFFTTFGSFADSPLKRDSQGSFETRLNLQ